MKTVTHHRNVFASLAMIALAASAVAQTATAPAASASAPTASPPPARAARTAPAPSPTNSALRPCTSVKSDPPIQLALGKSQVVHLDSPAARIVVGGAASSRTGRPLAAQPAPGMPPPQGGAPAPAAGRAEAGDGVADTEITLLSPTELYFLGRKTGSMNVILQGNDGRCVVKDIIVTVDPQTLQAKMGELMPGSSNVKVQAAENSIVLTGTVQDAVQLDQAITLASAYGDGKKVVNMLRVASGQQVMLEVKIAEVSKTLLDKLGSSVNLRRSGDGGRNTYSLISDFLSNGGGLVQALRIGRTVLNLDGQRDDGLVRVLAEPNIMAISGQTASFLSGGRIFIPVAQTNVGGFTTITLEEKEFGVSLKFTPTVLEGNRVNLKFTSEASELSQTGSPFTVSGGVTAILPSLTTRRVDTTVQLGDGQSFVVAGLIKNNSTHALNKFPGLGEAPVVGALFRSTEFQNDQTELMFVVTPRLVKPIVGPITLPTDNHALPSRGEQMFDGVTESRNPPPPVSP